MMPLKHYHNSYDITVPVGKCIIGQQLARKKKNPMLEI